MPDFLPELIDIGNGPLTQLLVGCKLPTVFGFYSGFELISACAGRVTVHPELLDGGGIHICDRLGNEAWCTHEKDLSTKCYEYEFKIQLVY